MTATDYAKARRQAAADYVQRVMLAVARVDGDDAVTTVPYFPGARTAHTVPRPLVGIAAARLVEQEARTALRRDVRAAREAGHIWHEIGTALGLKRQATDAGLSLGEAAHNWVVTGAADGSGPRQPIYRDSWGVIWLCSTCDQTISDQGPAAGHPIDSEPGHAPTCARLAAAITAYDDALASYDEED